MKCILSLNGVSWVSSHPSGDTAEELGVLKVNCTNLVTSVQRKKVILPREWLHSKLASKETEDQHEDPLEFSLLLSLLLVGNNLTNCEFVEARCSSGTNNGKEDDSAVEDSGERSSDGSSANRGGSDDNGGKCGNSKESVGKQRDGRCGGLFCSSDEDHSNEPNGNEEEGTGNFGETPNGARTNGICCPVRGMQTSLRVRQRQAGSPKR